LALGSSVLSISVKASISGHFKRLKMLFCSPWNTSGVG
jgi:hypothetical protein